MGSLMDLPILHDCAKPLRISQNSHILQRIAIDEQQVRQVSRLDLPQFMTSHHDLAAELGGGEDCLHRRAFVPLRFQAKP